MLEMGRNTTTILKWSSRTAGRVAITSKLKAMLRRNTVLQDLNLTGTLCQNYRFGGSSLSSVPTLHQFRSFGQWFDDMAAVMHSERLLRRNKTITRL
jgi:hypothetical protein